MKNIKTSTIKYLFLLPWIFSLSYAQVERTVNFQTGSLKTHVDMYRGNFSIYDMDEQDMDFVSLLFGSATTPSSSIDVTVDQTTETLDEMPVLSPLGVSLGSQVDGAFLAGEKRDVQVDVAFFSLDIAGTGDFNSVGIVVNVSNVSSNSIRNVGARIILDTDIGESRNNPLIYLPNGEKITNAQIFDETRVPQFLFVGQKNVAENRPLGKGFYIYPYLTGNIPNNLVVGNWRRLADVPRPVVSIPSSLAYTNGDVKDAGVLACYGQRILRPNESTYFGVVISKSPATVIPVLEDESIQKGVFSDDIYQVEEFLKFFNDPTIPAHTEMPLNTKENLYLMQQRQKQRELFRQKHIQTNITAPRSSSRATWDQTAIDGSSDSVINKYLYRLNDEILNSLDNIDNVLSNNTVKTNESHTIYKERLYELP